MNDTALPRLARLVAVVAVLVGLIVLHSPLCVDSMSPAAHAAMSSDLTQPDPVDDVPGSALATCLALVVTVLVAVAGLRQPGAQVAWHRALVREIMSRGVPRVRSPRLAELCVLRI